jgi:hypothetical protein
MSTTFLLLLQFGLLVLFWYGRRKRFESMGGIQGIYEAADREAFGLYEGEAIAKRWNAAFYLGALIPESLPSVGEKVLSFFASESLRGRYIRIGLTTANRIVFSVEPEPHESRPGRLATELDPSKAISQGYRPAVALTPASAPEVTDCRDLYGHHDAWADTMRSAPDVTLNSSDWLAPTPRSMRLARLDGMPGGRPWILWMDPEAMQFMMNYGVRRWAEQRPPVRDTSPSTHQDQQ